MRIYDEEERERSTDWLNQTFGPVSIHTPPPRMRYSATNNNHTYEIIELNARNGHAAVIATVQDTDGNPLPHIPTVWYWPDAPHLPGAGWLGRGVVGPTNEQGNIGHAMGKGADYAPPTKGPHALWIQGTDRSQMIDGLGMLTTLGRYHLDVVFQLRTYTPGKPSPEPPPPTPPPPTPPPELATVLQLIIEARQLIQSLIDGYTEPTP